MKCTITAIGKLIHTLTKPALERLAYNKHIWIQPKANGWGGGSTTRFNLMYSEYINPILNMYIFLIITAIVVRYL